MSHVVAGIDFGTQSVRVSVFDSARGLLGAASAEIPFLRKRDDPDHATQSHADQLRALTDAMRGAVREAGVAGDRIDALAVDATGSSVIPVDAALQPLSDYYLWCDHRAAKEAAEITAKAREWGLPAIQWCGGTYSPEWGFSKVLHWLRHKANERDRFATAVENCDLIVAELCGVTDAAHLVRSVCAMGHKWMWNAALGGLPPEDFLEAVDPLLAGVRGRIGGTYATSNEIAGHLSGEWAERLGLRAGIPVPVGALDAHWDAVGAGIRLGDVVNVVGTSTCVMAITAKDDLIPGVAGVVPGSIHPAYTGIEAGLSACGDLFDAIARRAGTTVARLSEGLESYRAGQTGLLRVAWDNGDRTVLMNSELGGMTLGWRLGHTAQDELFAAIEGTAFHTRIILDRMAQHGVPIGRIINAGGIPQKNPVLNQVYANVLGKPVLVPAGPVTSLGSAIFAFLAVGAFRTIEEAQDALCPGYRTFVPQEGAAYNQLFSLFSRVYFGFGDSGSGPIEANQILGNLRAGLSANNG